MFNMETIEKIDNNNRKALTVVNLALSPVESGDKIDTLSVLETVRDYLLNNDKIFDGNL